MKELADVSLKSFNSFGVGGIAQKIFMPENVDELGEIIQKSSPFIIIGGGTNLLISEEKHTAKIIMLKEMQEAKELSWTEDKKIFRAGASLPLKKIHNFISKIDSDDFLEISSIPGTLGGAIKMNAGCFAKNISDTLKSVTVTTKDGRIKILNKQEIEFTYRKSSISDDEIIIDATFEIKNISNQQSIKKRLDEINQKRKQSQPYGKRSAGSVFKNGNNYFAGKLIEDAGLKGLSIGGAEISTVHANFIVTNNKATANDVWNLIKHVQNQVKEKFNTDLELEIKLVGIFS